MDTLGLVGWAAMAIMAGLSIGYIVCWYLHVSPLLEQLTFMRRKGFEPRFPIEEPEPLEYKPVQET